MAYLVPQQKRMLAAASETGYAHPLYAQALSEFGTPVRLPESGGWLLDRPIPGTPDRDAMGPYPLFGCGDWSGIDQDLDELADRLASVVLVADPFGGYDVRTLESSFDRVIPFKTHFAIDFDRKRLPLSQHHRRNVKRGLREVVVSACNPAGQILTEWLALYGYLIQRHSIRGIQAFSRESFRTMFDVPGLVALRATDRAGECVGAQLWFRQGDVAYYHLGAANERGYRCSCSYALYDAAIEHFRGKVRWLDLGGGAGLNEKGDGLTRFKQGWSNSTKTAFLCGRILNRRRYNELTTLARAETSSFFPAYRSGESP